MKPTATDRHDATVHVVDDDPGVRKALSLLMRSAGLHAETYASALDFLRRYDPTGPGCIVLDIRMPGMSGLELQQALAARRDRTPVIILTGHADVPVAVRAMKAGAIDVINKPFQNGNVLAAVDAGLKRDARLREQQVRREQAAERLHRLTPREREVMEHLLQGKLNKVIAAELGISTRTVEIHRARIMRKMRARSLSTLVQMVLTVRNSIPNTPA